MRRVNTGGFLGMSSNAGIDTLVSKEVPIPKMGIAMRYRKVSIPELGIEIGYQKVSIPQRDNKIRYRKISITKLV